MGLTESQGGSSCGPSGGWMGTAYSRKPLPPLCIKGHGVVSLLLG